MRESILAVHCLVTSADCLEKSCFKLELYFRPTQMWSGDHKFDALSQNYLNSLRLLIARWEVSLSLNLYSLHYYPHGRAVRDGAVLARAALPTFVPWNFSSELYASPADQT